MWEVIQRLISPLITLSATVRKVYAVVTGYRSFVVNHRFLELQIG